MLRRGLSVEAVAMLILAAVDYRRGHVFVYSGKGGKQWVVYLRKDAYQALPAYLEVEPTHATKGASWSVRGAL